MAYIQGEGGSQGSLFPVVLDDLVPIDHMCRVMMHSSQGLRYQSLASSVLRLRRQDDPAMIHTICGPNNIRSIRRSSTFSLTAYCYGFRNAPNPAAIGHRLVHGGPRVRDHQRATPAVMEELRAAVSFAPLHMPSALSVLEAAARKFPDVAHVVCLDSTFHRNMPAAAKTFALQPTSALWVSSATAFTDYPPNPSLPN